MKPHYRLCRSLLRGLFWSCFRWQIIGAERIPSKGAVILASNHVSYLDPPLIGSAASREVFYLARESLFRFPVVGSFLRSVNALPVDSKGRSPKGLKSILDCLKDGGAVLLFPEGTRTKDGALQTARPGVGLAAVRSGAPIVPVHLYGAYEAWNRKMRFPRPRPITVVFGVPLRFGTEPRTRETYAAVSKRIMEAIASLNKDGASLPNLS